MNTRTSYVVIATIVAVLVTSTSAAYAQGYFDELACPDCPESEMIREQAKADLPIDVWTDKAEYDHESTITIEGKVSTVKQGTEIGLVVIGPPPFNNIVAVDQIKVGSDGKFKTTLSTAGSAWKYDGTYTIEVTYGNQQMNAKALVQLIGEGTKIVCAPGELNASGHCIPYTIEGGGVTGARLDVKAISLVINLLTTDDGVITLDIPRSVLDTDTDAEPLFILVDGEEADAEELVTSTTRRVTIMFPEGAEEIEIIGTFVIPEFGAIAALILAVAIISIIALSAKTRLNVFPKY
jgi:predicted secreted protein with PEFG-CTERM motif